MITQLKQRVDRPSRTPSHKMKSVQFLSLKILAILLAVLIGTGCSAADKKSRLLSRAESYFKNGEFEKAKIEYMNLLRLDLQNPIPYQRLGAIWFDQGVPLRAAPFLLKARELAPDDLSNREKLSRVYIGVGDLARAREEARSILLKAPNHGEPLMVLAETSRTPEEIAETEEQLRKFPEQDNVSVHLAAAGLAVRRGDIPSARKALAAALAADPKLSSAHMLSGTLFFLDKDMAQADREFKAGADLSPLRSIERLKYAEFKAQAGALEEASVMLKPITDQAPDYLPAWSTRAKIALAQKKYDEALALVENVFGRDPENVDARLIEAEARLAKGESSKAVETLERLDKSYPKVAGIKFQLARAYLRNNNPTQATAALNEAIASNPDYVEAILLLGEINLRTGNPQQTISALTVLLQKRPNIAPAQVLLAEAYRSQGQFDQAAAVVRDQIQTNPQNAQFYLLLGLILRQDKKLDEARKAFEKSLELTPNNLAAIDQLVEMEIAQKDVEHAMSRVQEQLKMSPESAPVHFLAAKSYAAQTKWDLAEKELLRTLELDAGFERAYGLLVAAYLAQNKLPEAIKQLETLSAKNPENIRVLMVAGMIYEKLNDLPKARDTYEKLLAIKPEFVPALNNLSYLYAEHLNQLDRAQELARKARALQPADASVADTLGWILYKTADYPQAVTLLQESAGKVPDNPEIQFHLGMASAMMGQTDAARTAFSKALQGAGDFPNRAEAERQLALLQGDSKQGKVGSQQLEAIVARQPKDPVARLRLAEIYEQNGQAAKAASAYEEAFNLNPKLTNAAVKVAELTAGPLKDKEKALLFIQKARDLSPNDAHVNGTLGGAAYEAGNFSLAYNLLQDSARQLPGEASVLHDFALAAYSVGKVSEAQQAMQASLQAAPKSPRAQEATQFLTLLALAQDHSALMAAEKQIQNVLTSDPLNLPALMAQAALSLDKEGKVEAVARYQEILKRFPDFALAQKRLAALYLDDPAHFGEAFDLASKASQALPGDPDVARVLGELSYKKKDFARAIQLLNESARLKPLDAPGVFYLGMSLREVGSKDEAGQKLTQALALGLPPILSAQAEQALREAKR